MDETNEAVIEEKVASELPEHEAKIDDGFKAGWVRDDDGKNKEEAEVKKEASKDDDPEITAPVKNDGKDVQRQKTLDGILRSKNAKIEESERERVRLAKEIEELKATKQPEKIKDVIEDSIVSRLRASPSMKNLEAEYGKEFVSAIEDAVSMVSDTYDKKYGELNQSWEAKIKTMMEESKKKLEQFDPVVRDHQQQLSKNHIEAIETAHPDFRDYKDSVGKDGDVVQGKLSEWISGHPLSDNWEAISKQEPQIR